LKRFAEGLQALPAEGHEWIYGRLNGSDFAVLAAGADNAEELGRRVTAELGLIAKDLDIDADCALPVGATPYQFGERLPDVLSRCDAALAAAVEEGGSAVQIVTAATTLADADTERTPDAREWQQLIDQSLSAKRLRIVTYPVVNAQQQLMHGECVARLQLADSGDWLPAGQFMPWMSRLNMTPMLDLAMLELALAKLPEVEGDLCLNISAQTLQRSENLNHISARLAAEPVLAKRLWLEVPEHGVFQYLDHFRNLCTLLKPLEVKLGIEHVGHQVSRLGQLHDIGFDYIKVDSSFVQDVDQSQGNQVFLRGLGMIARSIGLLTIAEGVRSDAEFKALIDLGFDGATGPGVGVGVKRGE